MKNKATLSFNDKVHDLNLISGSENEVALDISRLRQEANLITIDAGFKNTGSCQSAITFLDGENGILRYRGYSIEELANKAIAMGTIEFATLNFLIKSSSEL